MGTRGTYGFKKQGELKATYNHYDSYPSYLGVKIVEFIKEAKRRDKTLEVLDDLFDKIILVDEEAEPSQKQIIQCEKYFNEQVSTGLKTNWYCLLRDSQGELLPYLNNELKYMIGTDYLGHDYAYIINIDNKTLEVYKWGELKAEYKLTSENLDKILERFSEDIIYEEI